MKFSTDKMLSFLQNSYSAFHSVNNAKKILDENGFIALSESNPFNLQSGKGYYVIRNSTSLLAFKYNDKAELLRLATTHSDSPCYKLKRNPFIIKNKKYITLNLAAYGGMIHSTFFDRPLGLAGRVFLKDKNGIKEKLVSLDNINLIIPNLAIHMNREINNGYKYSFSKDISAVIGEISQDTETLLSSDNGQMKLLSDLFNIKADILGHDLFLYSNTQPQYYGINNEFIGSPRLDNLECSYCAIHGLINSSNTESVIPMVAMLDNEEVGSRTRQGADSFFVKDVLERIELSLELSNEDSYIFKSKSFLLSCDNAHGLHPNYSEKNDLSTKCYLGEGIVIKHTANQHYSTDGESEARFRNLLLNHKLAHQDFENPADVAGGYTLANLLNSYLAIPSCDCGLAQWAMHSAYELASSRDAEIMEKALKYYFSEKSF